MSRASADEGFSLLEVLFAAFIAFFVLTALFGVLISSSEVGRSAQIQEVGAQLANLVLEQIRALPYESIGTSGSVPPAPTGNLESNEATVFQGLSFTISREVTWGSQIVVRPAAR